MKRNLITRQCSFISNFFLCIGTATVICGFVSLAYAGRMQDLLMASRASMVEATGTPVAKFKYPQWSTASMSASNAPAPAMVYASSVYSSSYLPWYAFDASLFEAYTGLRWASEVGSPPEWILYDCGSGNSNVAKTLVINNPRFGNNDTFIFQGSNDSTNWTNLAATNTLANYSVHYFYNSYATTNFDYYRYFRVNFTVMPDTLVSVCFMKITSAVQIRPSMTSFNTPAPYVVTQSSLSANGTNQGGHCAFDNYELDDVNYYHRWIATNEFPAWVKIDMGSNVLVNGFGIDAANGCPSNFIISASINDSDYTTLVTTNLANSQYAMPGCTLYQDIVTTSTTAYRFYKFTATDTWTGAAAELWEILLWQYEVE